MLLDNPYNNRPRLNSWITTDFHETHEIVFKKLNNKYDPQVGVNEMSLGVE